MKFPHQVVLITGASSGIGAELAVQLARMGCRLGLLARREELLKQVAERVEAAGGKACIAVCDVGDAAQVAEATRRVEAALGPIDCVVANAGMGWARKRLEFDAAATEQLVRTNFLGMTNAFFAALPGMLARKRGHLVAVASLAGYQGLPQDAGYAASKAAMRIHCEGLRIELRGTGIDVSTICPGFIRTPLTDRNEFDMPFLLEVEAATRKLVRAIGKRRRVYNYPWQLWWLIKLGMHTPRWLYDAILGGQGAKMQAGRTQKYSNGLDPRS